VPAIATVRNGLLAFFDAGNEMLMARFNVRRQRKFLDIIYRTLKNKWVFADFPNFVLAEGA
jgi:hypothetical protein